MWRTQELLTAGQPRTITHLIQSGALVRARRGCYVRGSWWSGLKPDVRSRQLILAHAMEHSRRRPAVLSTAVRVADCVA